MCEQTLTVYGFCELILLIYFPHVEIQVGHIRLEYIGDTFMNNQQTHNKIYETIAVVEALWRCRVALTSAELRSVLNIDASSSVINMSLLRKEPVVLQCLSYLTL